jgi:hypothetical protein
LIPLTYLKQGLHNVFRAIRSPEDRKELRFEPFYQEGAIAAITREYQNMLVEKADDEEALQRFLEDNPILWTFLSPTRIWKKPHIGTKYVADFAILNSSNILHLVEIEKPATKLVKRNGGVSAELQGALDQIRDWKIEVAKRREAILDGMELTQQDVLAIRYMVVAGLAGNTHARGLEKIRDMKTDADVMLCFDDLASSLHCTQAALYRL